MHQHNHNPSGQKLFIPIWLNLGITAVQIVGGLLSNSLALLSDALHNLGDGLALLIARIANKVSRRSSSEKKTFGYKRIEIHFECHVHLNRDYQISETDAIRAKAEGILHEQFQIGHVTMQMEFNSLHERNMFIDPDHKK